MEQVTCGHIYLPRVNSSNLCVPCHARTFRDPFAKPKPRVRAVYQERLEAQGGVCAICEQPQEGKRLASDHDAKTGRIRGLLCNRCNLGLGYFKDNAAYLGMAVAYLEEYRQ